MDLLFQLKPIKEIPFFLKKEGEGGKEYKL